MFSSSPFFANYSAAALIQETLQPAEVIRVATAYFEPSGYQVLQDALAGKQVLLLIGREEGGRDKLEAVLDEFVERFLARPLERRTHAMRQMLDALENNRLLITVGNVSAFDAGSLLDARYLYQHAKLYIADETAAVVTSANLSYHGLVRSVEAGIRVTDPVDVRYFVEQFDLYFRRAVSITDALIERLRQLLSAHLPYVVYARALLELYELPDDEVPAQLPPLSAYQRPVVSRTLDALRDYRGSMMVASTGLGKTVMAAHIAAYLRMHGNIDRVLVICPAGLKENWRRHMGMARVSSVEFSYSTFSLKDAQKFFSLRQLEYELRAIDEKTLVLIDESHHLRNPEIAANRQKERYERVFSAIHKRGAYALLLTATPFSRGIKDVNAQLRLLPQSEHAAKGTLIAHKAHWSVQSAAELPDLPPCPTLTTPTVVYQFSQEDNHGHRYVHFTKGGRRYFPHHIHLKTVVFENALDKLLIELLSGDLLNIADENVMVTTPLPFGDIDWQPLPTGRGAGLRKAEIVKQFCSSPAQIKDLFDKLGKAGGFKKTRFANQQELTKFVRRNLREVERHAGRDTKFHQLLEIIKGTDNKVVVFCYYRQTARAISEQLKAKGIRAETTQGHKGEQIDSLLRRFAPVANEVIDAETVPENIQVLVVTSSLAEGYNLQDASVLVNYDLPWTVLILAQRMGRVLRPWHQPREITIYNFVPEAMLNSQIQIAMRWYNRLQERNAQHRALADIPVMHSGNSDEDDGYEMAALAQHLQAQTSSSLNLDEVLSFVEQTESIGTSNFFMDLLRIKPDERERILGLPPGFRSAQQLTTGTSLFLLVRYRRRLFAGLFNRAGNIVLDAEHRDQIIEKIRCVPNTPLSAQMPDDDTFDEWIAIARTRWCQQHSYMEDEVQIVCAMALTSS